MIAYRRYDWQEREGLQFRPLRERSQFRSLGLPATDDYGFGGTELTTSWR